MATMLAENQIHIHVIDLDQPASVQDNRIALLSPDELERAEHFVFEHLKRRFVLSRGGLRQILGRYLLKDPKAIRILYTEKEKPYLDPPPLGRKETVLQRFPFG